MALDIRTSQDQLEDLVRDSILFALGKRVASVASVAALRAFVTRGMTGTALDNDSLANVVVSGSVTAAYRWNTESTLADNGTSVIKPTDVTASGRWLRWTANARFVPVIGGNSYALNEIVDGPILQVIVLDKADNEDDITRLISGQVPSVIIEATNDKPTDYQLNTGSRWNTEYYFKISVITQNLRDRRQATHGWTADDMVGANKLDGFIKSLLAGTNLSADETGIRNVQVGGGENWYSGETRRRIIRTREYTFQTTEELPAAPNDAVPLEGIDFQEQLTDLGQNPADPGIDPDNEITLGMTVALGVGLTKTVVAGTAFFDGDEVTYAGESHTFTASRDTYRDLNPDGTMTFVEALYDYVPELTADAMRIGMTRTDGSGVISDIVIATTYVPQGPIVEVDL